MKHSITFFTKSITILCLLFTFYFAHSQNQQSFPGVISQLVLDGDSVKCTMHSDDAVTAEFFQNIDRANVDVEQVKNALNGRKKKNKETGANIVVVPLNLDPAFEPQFVAAQEAFQAAVDIWAQEVSSDETIFVLALFQPLDPGVLGSAGSTRIYANFPGMEKDTWYGNALADKLVGEDLDPTLFDIVANFSTVFPNWYFGTDGNTPANDYDFKTVVLHELCHGLGFFGSMFVDNATGIGSWGFGIPDPIFPAIYDRLANDKPGKQLIKENKFPNFSTQLGDVLLDDPLIFRGPNTVRATRGKGAQIFTVLDLGDNEIPGLTNTWLPGSSYSHVDFLTYAGGPEGLMVPFLLTGLSYDNPGAIVNGIFDDMGWNGVVNNKVPGNARVALSDDNTPEILFRDNIATKVYPNPFRGSFILQMDQEKIKSISSVQLLDAIGRDFQVPYGAQQPHQLFFDLSSIGIEPGAYFLKLSFQNAESRVLRIMKTN